MQRFARTLAAGALAAMSALWLGAARGNDPPGEMGQPERSPQSDKAFVKALVEKILESEVREKVGISLAKVTCPEDIPRKAGETYDCTGTDEQGTTATFNITTTEHPGIFDWGAADNFVNME